MVPGPSTGLPEAFLRLSLAVHRGELAGRSERLKPADAAAISRAFKKAGLDWQTDFAEAIKANKRERIKLWLKLLPYLVTQRNSSTHVKRWKGKASKAALIALQALEGKQ